jgi:hypothetical protein
VSDNLHINVTPQYCSLLYDLRKRGMYQTILQIKLCMDLIQLPYTQTVPLAGSTVKILPARGTKSQKTENI